MACVVTRRDHAAPHPPYSAGRTRLLVAGAAAALVALGCVLAIFRNLAAPAAVATAEPDTPVAAIPAEPLFDVALMHATYPIGAPAAFSHSRSFGPIAMRFTMPGAAHAAVQAALVPLPTPRPAALGLPQAEAPQTAQRTKPAKPDDPFQKLFGKRETVGTLLAYAPSDGGVLNDGQSIPSVKLPPNDGLTAIYDIAARTVYLPDGTRLEAHSGLGPKMDDPRYVHVKMHGATPPHVYDLIPREALFHGVQALRMIPVGGEGAIFGRTGLLTHSYLLGPRGDSNGCVSFRDYDAFLRAYQDGKVKRLVVVASLG
jgi:hypothetical protein